MTVVSLCIQVTSYADFLLFISQPPQDLFSEESDTASVTSSIASPKMERKFKKTKYNVQPRIDTNLTPKRKEKVAKSSAVATPRLKLTTPIPYNTSRSRDPSPARGASRSREPSPVRNANRWGDPLLIDVVKDLSWSPLTGSSSIRLWLQPALGAPCGTSVT